MGVEVVGGDAAVVPEVPAGDAVVEVDDPGGPVDVPEQRGRRAGVGERRPAELPQQFQVVLPRAAHRADHPRDVGGKDRQESAEPALHRQHVHDVGVGEPGLRPGQHDVVDLHRQHRPSDFTGSPVKGDSRRAAALGRAGGRWILPAMTTSPAARPAAMTTEDAATTAFA